eukprot:246415_1
MPLESISKELVSEIRLNFKELKTLNLSHNEISMINNLFDLYELEDLDLSFNRISVLENVESLQSLRILNVANNKITHISLGDVPRLESLDLRHNLIPSSDTIFEGLKGCLKLQDLWLEGNPVSSNISTPELTKFLPQISSLDGQPLANVLNLKRSTLLQSKILPPEAFRTNSKLNSSQIRKSGMAFVADSDVNSDTYDHSPTNSTCSLSTHDVPSRFSRFYTPQRLPVRDRSMFSTPSVSARRFDKQPERKSILEGYQSKRFIHERRLNEMSGNSLQLSGNTGDETEESRCVDGRIMDEREKMFLEGRVASLQHELDKSQKALQNERDGVRKLRTYFGVTHGQCQSVAPDSKNIERTKPDDFSVFEKEIDSLKAQLFSIKRVADIQEDELNQRYNNDGNEYLTKWRQNVFKLIVQQKSDQIVRKHLESDHERETSSLQTELKSAVRSAEIQIERQKATQAELDLTTRQKQTLEDLQTNLKSDKSELEARIESGVDGRKALFTVLHEVPPEIENLSRFSGLVDTRLSELTRRLEFAVSRLSICKELTSQKSICWKGRLSDLEGDGISNNAVQDGSSYSEGATVETAAEHTVTSFDVSSKSSRNYLELEIERLSDERCRLLSNLETFSDAEAKRLDALKEEHMDAISSRDADISELQLKLDRSREEIELNSNNFKEVKSQMEQRILAQRNNHEELQKSLKTKVSDQEQSLAAMVSECQQLKENSTKSAADASKWRRELSHCKEEHQKELEIVRTDFESQLEAKTREISNVEKERDQLMAKLRTLEKEVISFSETQTEDVACQSDFRQRIPETYLPDAPRISEVAYRDNISARNQTHASEELSGVIQARRARLAKLASLSSHLL